MTPSFLSEEEVHIIHEEALHAFGGQNGVRSESLLKSAIAMPEQSFGGDYLHAYPFGMAAAYAFHLAENQPFIDGNKRVALLSALQFLKRAGFEIDDPENKLYTAMIDVGNHRLTKEGLADLLKNMAAPKM